MTTRQQRILIVDDEPDLLDVMHFFLHRAGYDVLQASSGNEAMKLLRGTSVDIVVSDVRMQDGDGVQLIEDLRAHEKASRLNPVPVLLVTGFATITRDEALKKGALDLLSKPISPDNLMKAIQSALAG